MPRASNLYCRCSILSDNALGEGRRTISSCWRSLMGLSLGMPSPKKKYLTSSDPNHYISIGQDFRYVLPQCFGILSGISSDSRLRSGGGHCRRGLAVEVRSWQLRSGG